MAAAGDQDVFRSWVDAKNRVSEIDIELASYMKMREDLEENYQKNLNEYTLVQQEMHFTEESRQLRKLKATETCESFVVDDINAMKKIFNDWGNAKVYRIHPKTPPEMIPQMNLPSVYGIDLMGSM